MRALIQLLLLLLPGHALAHAVDGAEHWWTLDPWVYVPMILFAGLYLRGLTMLRAKTAAVRGTNMWAVVIFFTGMASLFVALIWPLDALSDASFAAHMAQHMVLIVVAAPLLVLAEPQLPLLLGMPTQSRRAIMKARWLRRLFAILVQPRVAFSLHGAIIWVWHAPLLYEWALRNRAIHIIEHVSFFGSALLFWHAMLRVEKSKRSDYGITCLYTLATLIHTGMLGALLTFSPRLLYSEYLRHPMALLSPLEDQQLAGLLMWVPGGVFYLVAGLILAGAWLKSSDGMPESHRATPAHSKAAVKDQEVSGPAML